MTTNANNPIEVLKRLAEMAPALEDQARETDDTGVPEATIEQILQSGVLSIADQPTRLEAQRTIARACAATAWLTVEFAEACDLLIGLGEEARTEVDARRVIVARNSDDGVATSTTSGFRISGAWSGVGGAAHADWILLTNIRSAAGQSLVALVRRADAVASPYHYLGGLRGVGWCNLAVEALDVPENRVVPAERIAGLGLGSNRLAGVLTGCAEGGFADYVRTTRSRIAGIGGGEVATFTQVQSRLAESEAELEVVTGLFEALKRDIASAAAGNDAVRTDRDRAYAARTALDAVTRLVRQMGAMGLAETNPVQRRYRDLRTIAADPGFAWDGHMARHGRQLLGLAENSERGGKEANAA